MLASTGWRSCQVSSRRPARRSGGSPPLGRRERGERPLGLAYREVANGAEHRDGRDRRPVPGEVAGGPAASDGARGEGFASTGIERGVDLQDHYSGRALRHLGRPAAALERLGTAARRPRDGRRRGQRRPGAAAAGRRPSDSGANPCGRRVRPVGHGRVGGQRRRT